MEYPPGSQDPPRLIKAAPDDPRREFRPVLSRPTPKPSSGGEPGSEWTATQPRHPRERLVRPAGAAKGGQEENKPSRAAAATALGNAPQHQSLSGQISGLTIFRQAKRWSRTCVGRGTKVGRGPFCGLGAPILAGWAIAFSGNWLARRLRTKRRRHHKQRRASNAGWTLKPSSPLINSFLRSSLREKAQNSSDNVAGGWATVGPKDCSARLLRPKRWPVIGLIRPDPLFPLQDRASGPLRAILPGNQARPHAGWPAIPPWSRLASSSPSRPIRN